MRKIVPIMLLLSLNSSLSSAKSTSDKSTLFLVGGGLKSCSSMSLKHCSQNAFADKQQLENAKKHALYSINLNSIKLLNNAWPETYSLTSKQNIIKVLTSIQKAESANLISPTQLKALFKEYDNRRVIKKLNDAEYYLMLDLLEQPVMAKGTDVRLKEQVDLGNSTHLFSTEIYRSFVNLAKDVSNANKPKILVITASARDPFEAVDFYQQAFSQAGSDASWLPLDATLNALIQQPGNRKEVCQQLAAKRLEVQGSMNREWVYPDLIQKQLEACLSPQKMLDDIASADGIFINGGDQSLTLGAFINIDGSDSQALELIKQKLIDGKLVIGGTSAGTAVMSGGTFNQSPVVMITNGQSNTALVRGAKKDVLPIEGCQKSARCAQNLLNDDLTYRSKGGLGLFHWGILDTHFSERGRQGRLAKLTLDTDARFAFGVDEATALVVEQINNEQIALKVVGQSGVFIVDNSLNSKDKTSVMTHYITRDDKLSLSSEGLNFSFSQWKTSPMEKAELPLTVADIFTDNRYQQTAELLCRTDNSQVAASSTWNKQSNTISIEKPVDAISRFGVMTWKNTSRSYCSYQNYILSF